MVRVVGVVGVVSIVAVARVLWEVKAFQGGEAARTERARERERERVLKSVAFVCK